MEQFLMEVIAQKAFEQGAKIKVTFDNSNRLPYEEKVGPFVGTVAQVEDSFCMIRIPYKSFWEPSRDQVCYYMFLKEIEILAN